MAGLTESIKKAVDRALNSKNLYYALFRDIGEGTLLDAPTYRLPAKAEEYDYSQFRGNKRAKLSKQYYFTRSLTSYDERFRAQLEASKQRKAKQLAEYRDRQNLTKYSAQNFDPSKVVDNDPLNIWARPSRQLQIKPESEWYFSQRRIDRIPSKTNNN
eukprot:TRINITY_DN1587_c0_g1_i1.p1 TRINITY_DN1587_c0_g1~~TRINITY_DN1587_c0_g1_i1.p1  ORF type:complete len:158 (+),score=23.94 TRINITY_DN1587_c0_g1_i1:188-661(+)